MAKTVLYQSERFLSDASGAVAVTASHTMYFHESLGMRVLDDNVTQEISLTLFDSHKNAMNLVFYIDGENNFDYSEASKSLTLLGLTIAELLESVRKNKLGPSDADATGTL